MDQCPNCHQRLDATHSLDAIVISVVLPVYNEELILVELHRRLNAALSQLKVNYELLFIDDGSKDRSFEILEELHRKDPAHTRIIKFSRNFGHHIAITAGMDFSKGQYVVVMDSDLQDQPEEIAKLYTKVIEGFDVVYGVRKKKKHGFIKRNVSAVFVRILNWIIMSDIPITTTIFRIMSRKYVDNFNRMREQHRFVVGLMSWMGFKQTGIEVIHAERFAGETKYTLFKMIKLAIHSFTAFSFWPLQLSSMVGLATSMASLVAILIFVIRRVVFDLGVEGWTSVMVAVLFIGGIQLLALGVIGEYLGRNFMEQKGRPLYFVEKAY